MRIEKYHNSILEHKTFLKPTASKMVEDENYINFFTTCGPNYVHTIFRAHEVTAMFTFESASSDLAQDFASKLRLLIFGNKFVFDGVYSNVNGSSSSSSTGISTSNTSRRRTRSSSRSTLTVEMADILNSLSIEFFVYGLGNTNSFTGSSSSSSSSIDDNSFQIVSTTLKDYNNVMRYALESMTRKSDDDNGDNTSNTQSSDSGMIYAIKVIPWVDHPEFKNLAKIEYNKLSVPIERRSIINSKNVTNEDGDEETICPPMKLAYKTVPAPYLSPSSSSAPVIELIMDDFGKCCEDGDIQDVIVKIKNAAGTISTSEDEKTQYQLRKSCQPERFLTPAIMSVNMQTNAEFITRLNSVVNEKINAMNTFGQCTSALRSFPKQFDYLYLRSAGKARYDDSVDMEFTVKDLRAAFDPRDDLGIISLLSNENDEYFEMFYQPCLSALYGMNAGNDRDTDPKFFMAEPWYNHDECSKVSCLDHNMAWDRQNGNGCVNGLLARQAINTPIPTDSDPHCAISIDSMNGQEICRHTADKDVIKQMDLCREFVLQANDGSGGSVPVSLGYLMDYFCMPRLSEDQADTTKMEDVDSKSSICNTGLRYPKCKVGLQSDIGDGFCERLYYNADCNYDGGDCEAFTKWETCDVEFPYLVGDGFCNGGKYNVEGCDWDGGDCEVFNIKSPECNVPHPFLIGNGFCDGEKYNVKECDWDGGDCTEYNI
jgi:hypothetical protein